MNADELPELASVRELAAAAQTTMASVQHLLRTRHIPEDKRIGPAKMYGRAKQHQILALVAQVRRALPRQDGMELARERVQMLYTDLDTRERQALGEGGDVPALSVEVVLLREQVHALQATVDRLTAWQREVTDGLHKLDVVLGVLDERQSAIEGKVETMAEHVGSYLLNDERRLEAVEDALLPDHAVDDVGVVDARHTGRAFLTNAEADLLILAAQQASRRPEED